MWCWSADCKSESVVSDCREAALVESWLLVTTGFCTPKSSMSQHEGVLQSAEDFLFGQQFTTGYFSNSVNAYHSDACSGVSGRNNPRIKLTCFTNDAFTASDTDESKPFLCMKEIDNSPRKQRHQARKQPLGGGQHPPQHPHAAHLPPCWCDLLPAPACLHC